MIKVLVVLLTVALATASVFAIWPVVADAPWESKPSPVSVENDTDSTTSTRLDIENAVRQAIHPDLRARLEGVDSKFLGDATWEVDVEYFGFDGQRYVAVFRVRDGSLIVQPLNGMAEQLSGQ